jgi:hypothetical protein
MKKKPFVSIKLKDVVLVLFYIIKHIVFVLRIEPADMLLRPYKKKKMVIYHFTLTFLLHANQYMYTCTTILFEKKY